MVMAVEQARDERRLELEYMPDLSDLAGLVVTTAAQRVWLVGGIECGNVAVWLA
jgi:hypothetical protein